jgi:hypothetical protein
MEFRKMRLMGGGESAGTSLPKEDLQEMGFVDEDGNIIETYVRVERSGEREFTIELLE